MPVDWEELRYRLRNRIHLLRQRPGFKRQMVIGGVGAIVAMGTLVVWLSWPGAPKEEPRRKGRTGKPAAPAAADLKGVFRMADDLMRTLQRDPRFAEVVLVPTGDPSDEMAGHIMIMGEVATRADLDALRAAIGASHPAVGLDWQVVVSDLPPGGGP